MSFLGKIRGMFGGDAEPHSSDAPLRNRTFSATQFRDAELARAAEARERSESAKIDAAEVLSPAINPVAETLMADDSELPEPEVPEPQVLDPAAPEPEAPEPEELEPEAVEPVAAESEVDKMEPAPAVEPVVSAADPMPWEEAVGWLSQRSAETRNFVGQYWNWDHDLRVLHFLAQQPDLDAGVAAHIFWLTAANEEMFPFGDDEPEGEAAQQVSWLTDFLGRRFSEGDFRPASYGFDDSWDCERLKQHLADLHEAGRIDWSPEAIPTSSQAELMSFEDIPEEERGEVTGFLARFGVY
ncbi:MAG TPA: hypothetical protein VFR36_06460 [Sphingomicrobium sp.]|nr:hypothetical protein [Sphingomicrobium sp.]